MKKKMTAACACSFILLMHAGGSQARRRHKRAGKVRQSHRATEGASLHRQPVSTLAGWQPWGPGFSTLNSGCCV